MQRGCVRTLPSSSKTARERCARSVIVSNAAGDLSGCCALTLEKPHATQRDQAKNRAIRMSIILARIKPLLLLLRQPAQKDVAR